MSQPKDEWTLYHNPRCSKSRGALELLAERGITPRVVEYLKTPLDEAGLRALLKKLGKAPREIVRTKEPAFAALKLDLSDDAAVIRALAKHPELMERPIAVRGNRAVVARPPENLEELL